MAVSLRDFLLLAVRLRQRYEAHGDLDDLDASIDELERCVDAMDTGEPPFALVLSALGESLGRRYARTGDLDDLERGIDLMEQALAIREMPETLVNLTTGLMRRYDRTSQLDELDRIIDLCDRAHALGDSDPAVFNNLGFGLRRHHLHTGAVSDLDRAISVLNEGLDRAHGNPPRLIHLLTNIGGAHLERFHRSGDLADLELGIRATRGALDLLPPGAPDRPLCLHTRGVLLMERYTVARDAGDAEEGIRAFQEAVDGTLTDSPDLPMFLMALGNALSQWHDTSGNEEALARAIDVMELGVELTPQGSPIRARHLSNLSNALGRRYHASNDPADHERSIALLEEALDAAPAQTPERLLNLGNLAEEVRRQWMRTGSDDDLQRASRLFAEAARESIDAAPSRALQAALNWGHWAFRRRAWSEVITAHHYVREARERLAAAQLDRQSRSDWLRRGQGFAGRAAYASAMAGDMREAVVVLELGRTRLLAESLERDRADLESIATADADLVRRYRQAADRIALLENDQARLGDRIEAARTARHDLEAAVRAIRLVPGYERFLQPPTWSEIEAMLDAQAADSAVVYLLTTSEGSLALVAAAGQIEPVWSSFDSDALDEALIRREEDGTPRGFLPGQFGERTIWIERSLDGLLDTLGAALMGPVASRLRARGIRNAVLIPTGRLASLPLHAARYEDRSLLDDVVVSYAPSLRALAASRREAAARTGEPFLLAVANDTLEEAGGEVRQIAKWFRKPRRTVLRGEKVRRERVLEAMEEATHLHFACHGEFDPRETLASYIQLREGEMLTLGDLIHRDARPRRARLAVLSACQSALADFRHLPDEVIGMPAGFLEAGVPAVVGTLWPVNDTFAARLMVRFYELHLRDGRPGPDALCEAQRWLRDTRAAGAFHWAAFVYVGA